MNGLKSMVFAWCQWLLGSVSTLYGCLSNALEWFEERILDHVSFLNTYLKNFLIELFSTDEDRAGPIALACLLALAIIINFVVKLYDYANA